jgi:hypothetical protein
MNPPWEAKAQIMKRAAKIIFITVPPFPFFDPLQAFYTESAKKSQGLAPVHSGDIHAPFPQLINNNPLKASSASKLLLKALGVGKRSVTH